MICSATANDLRELPFAERAQAAGAFIAKLDDPRIDLSPTIAFDSWDALTAARDDPASAGAGEDAEAVEGVMLKRRDAPICRAARRANGGSGSATRTSSTPC
jgi:DNA ligase-1